MRLQLEAHVLGACAPASEHRWTFPTPHDARILSRDAQTCSFTIGVYTENAEEVRVGWKANRSAFGSWDKACPSGWTPTAHRYYDMLQSFPDGDWSYAYAEIDFTRRDGSTMFKHFALLACGLVTLSYLGFWINPSATPARVALGTICILAVVTNQHHVQGTLPPGATEVWLVDFLTGCLLFNLFAFVEQVSVNFGRVRGPCVHVHVHVQVHAHVSCGMWNVRGPCVHV